MVCDKCDPNKIRRREGIEKTIIDLPEIDVGPYDDCGWETRKCRFCGQQYNIITINDELRKILADVK